MHSPNDNLLLSQAVDDTMADVASRPEWREEVERGKMFGVLIAKDSEGTLHTLRAYSGQILGRSDWDGYVPAVFDYLQPDGYFKQHEAEIDAINREITLRENSVTLRDTKLTLRVTVDKSKAEIDAYKAFIQQQRATRTTAEAQYQNAQLHRLKQQWKKRIAEKEAAVNALTQRIDELKADRAKRSDALQLWLFEQFKLAGGTVSTEKSQLVEIRERSVLQIFTDYARENHLKQTIPPAGTGECCAPKLLHYANSRGWVPVAMTEFWYGASPKGEVRHHGMHYEPCQAKCMPLMPWLWGETSSAAHPPFKGGLEGPLFEDDWLIAIDKPAGLLSVPGKRALPNAESMLVALVASRRPDGVSHDSDKVFLKVVHRLDMDTSGVLLAAKTPEFFVTMQRQFAAHETVKKEYEAILSGKWDDSKPRKGTISLPLSADFLNRPRQRVDYEGGKQAVTEYEVLEEISMQTSDGKRLPCTRILLRPLTGRTHQLRVHCAHADGLAMPILGDPLYGNVPADRMYLHARLLTFRHPITNELIKIGTQPHCLL